MDTEEKFVILMEEQSYLAEAFEGAFEKQNVKAEVAGLADASTILVNEKAIGYLIYTSEELLKKAVSVKVIVDQAVKHKIPVFVMGNVEELEKLWTTISEQMVMDVFIRPINMGETVENICTQLDEFYRTRKKVILAVDDSGMILRNIKTLLEDKYKVVLANSGAMAIKYLALNIPDLILLDYEMPIVDGKQVMQMIREDPDCREIPIIFLTGKNDAQIVMDVMGLKPEGYLLKSMEPKKLHEAIDDFFEKKA